MQSTLTLTLDLDSKIGTLTDATNYSSLGLTPVTYGVKGTGYIKFNGQIIVAGNSYSSPLIDLTTITNTRQFNLELDVNGEVANGIYTVEYIAQAQYTTNATSSAANDTITIDSPNYNSTLFSNPENIYLSVTGIGTYSYGNIISVADDGGGNPEFSVASVGNFASSLRYVNLGFRTVAQAFVYSGCEKITQDIGFTYDCDTDPTGSWNVYSNTPTPSGVTVGQATGTIEWPSWTGEPTITISSLPYSNTALATGTYGATISQVVTQEIQASPLLEITYTLENTYEWKVTCAGSLCDMNACIESLRSAHESELLKNKISKYQPYIDNVAIYLHEAYNYKSCGEFDKYRETLAKVKATLDASGCDCGCCDDNEYKWVAVSPATSTFLNSIMSEIQFRVGSSRPTLTTQATGKGLETGAIWHDTSNDNLYKATVTGASITWALYYDPSLTSITTAANGLTELPIGTVKLGGSLTANTTIGLQDHTLTFEAAFGTTYIKRDGSSNSTPAYPLAITGQYVNPGNLSGASIVYETQQGFSSGKTLGYTTYLWEDYANKDSQFRIYANENGTIDWKFLVQSDGQLKAQQYGEGNFQNNSPQYFLGVDSSNAFVEIDPTQVGATASNGLTKTSGNIKLGGTLTADTQVGLSSNQLDFYSATGTLQFSKNQINGPASTRAVQIKSVKNGAAFLTGQGPAIDFSVGPSNSNTVIGSISSTWNNVGTDAIMGFDVYDTNFATTKFKIYGNNGVLEAPGYGLGNLVNNSPQYLLGVLTNGEFVEVDPISPLVYIAELTQTGNTPPVATVIKNTTGATLTWAYSSPGFYYLNASANVFTNNKTYISITPSVTPPSAPAVLGAMANATNQCTITSVSVITNANANTLLNGSFIKIEIYP